MRYIPLPRKEKLRIYSGEFANLDLVNGRFQFPEQLLITFRHKHPEIPVEFYAHPINEEDKGIKYVSLFDPNFVESDKSSNLNSGAYVIIPDSNGLVNVGSDFMKYLNLTDKISVEGYGKIVRLWNPNEFEEYLGPGVKFNGNLEDYMKECFGYSKKQP